MIKSDKNNLGINLCHLGIHSDYKKWPLNSFDSVFVELTTAVIKEIEQKIHLNRKT